KAILDVSNEDRRMNAVAIVAGPGTVDALVDRFLACAQALLTAQNDRALWDEYHRIRDCLRNTRPAIFAAAIAARASSDDPTITSSLASLVFLHGTEDGDRKRPLEIEPATKAAWINLLRGWVEAVI